MLLRTRLLVLLSSTCTLPAQWSLVAAAPPGTPLALAFDDSRNVAVGAFLVGNALQTWEWNGAAWSQNVAAGSPGSVMGVFVYDPQRRAVLSIDAEGASSNGPDLYEYRGAAWSLLPQAGVRPPAAQIVAGAFDTRRNVLVVQVLDQTWEWDGAQWLLRATTTAPGRVEYARMAYDPLRQRTVMTGGERYDPVTRQTLPTGETWEWDGSSWTLAAQGASGVRKYHAMAWDAAHGRVVVFGGWYVILNHSVVLGDFLEWTGSAWQQSATGLPVPPPQFGSQAAFDRGRGRLELVGGWPSTPVPQTWEYARAQGPTYRSFGTPCGTPGAQPRLDLAAGAMPWIGQRLQLRLSELPPANAAVLLLGLSATQWGGAALPLPLAPFGMAGCTAYASGDAPYFVTGAGGGAVWSHAVPASAALVGVTFFAQAYAFSPGANAAGLVASDAGALRIGLP